MTNEELATNIKNGNTALIEELWKNLEKLTYKCAVKFYLQNCKGQSVSDVDDLIQLGYFAMMAAVDRYDPESDIAFSTVFYQKLYDHFCRFSVNKLRKHTQADFDVLSLDDPIPNAEDLTLGDTVPDNNDSIAAWENGIQNEQLHADLEAFMQQTLTQPEVELLNKFYYADKTIRQIAGDDNAQVSKLNAMRIRSIKKLRKAAENGFAECLEEYMQGRLAIKNIGIQKFMLTHSSQCEQYVIDKEDLMERFFNEVVYG